jgi:ADP-ribose pyrophosphatase YjhB (NUDIX family)
MVLETRLGGGVVLNQKNQVMVVSQQGRSWSLPKGHIDPGEDARQAAVREIEEESGVTQLTYLQDLGTYQRHRIGIDGGEDKSELKTIDIFLYRTNEMNLEPIDPENPEAKWLVPEDVGQILTHPKDKAFFAQVLPAIKEVIAKTP